jgi:hypothetical protein
MFLAYFLMKIRERNKHFIRRHDAQHNDTQPNNVQHNYKKYNTQNNSYYVEYHYA